MKKEKIIRNLPIDFPLEFIDILLTWSIHKSPYGHSYYNCKVDWNGKPDKSFRIADHWNFECRGTKHCETTENCPDNTHWTLAQYDGELKKYVVIKSISKKDELLLAC